MQDSPTVNPDIPAPTYRSSWGRQLAPLWRNKLVLVGAILALLIVGTALLASALAPHDPIEMSVANAFQGPSPAHWFGTDRFGRDVLSRVIYGSRVSLWVGLVSILGATVLGTVLGVLSGYFGSWTDHGISRTMDILFSFPSLILAIAIAAMLGPGVNNAIIAIVIVYIPLFSRVARGAVLAEQGKEYVDAARVAGSSNTRIMHRHILPNILSPLIIQASIGVSYAILLEAYLSYLGLGTQPPAPSWGTMLNEGKTFLEVAPWVSIFPGLGIMAAVLAFNLLGDGLRDMLDPRSR